MASLTHRSEFIRSSCGEHDWARRPQQLQEPRGRGTKSANREAKEDAITTTTNPIPLLHGMIFASLRVTRERA
jgi:hypothetical protein